MCSFNGWGVSVYDALDTLFIMGLGEQLDRALAHVANGNFPQKSVSTRILSLKAVTSSS